MKRLHFFIKTTRSRLILQSTGAHTAERIILLFKADHFLGLDQFLDWNMYIQLHILMSSKVMFILNIIIVSLKSSKGFGSGKKREYQNPMQTAVSKNEWILVKLFCKTDYSIFSWLSWILCFFLSTVCTFVLHVMQKRGQIKYRFFFLWDMFLFLPEFASICRFRVYSPAYTRSRNNLKYQLGRLDF